MKNIANIKLSAVRLTAGLLMIMLFIITQVRFFHYHEDLETHSEKEHHNQTDNCAICDYFLHKHSVSFTLSGGSDLRIFAALVFVLLYEVIRQEIEAFNALPSNKAPPLLY